jgi:hypothetical protein
MLYLYMGTFTINIPQMLPYMPNIRILVIEWNATMELSTLQKMDDTLW